MKTYIHRDGTTYGPYSAEEINTHLKSAALARTDLACNEGGQEWVPLSQLLQQRSQALNPPNIPKVKKRKAPILKLPKVKKKVVPRKTWRDDPATKKQIDFLKSMGVKNLPVRLSKGDASEMIEGKVDGANVLSPKQKACLRYHGHEPSFLGYDEAKDLLDAIHDTPHIFPVEVPWERAKYRLHPDLYPRSRFGCLKVFVIGFVVVVIWRWLMF